MWKHKGKSKYNKSYQLLIEWRSKEDKQNKDNKNQIEQVTYVEHFRDKKK